MGTRQSAPRAPICVLPPIDTKDQFQARFRQVFQSPCLAPRERDWLQTVFEKFSSTSQSSIGWTESDLIEFMGITLPEGLKSDLNRAGPLLYRCIQRLGAFPWHNQPLQAQGLNYKTLVTAIVILLRRCERNVDSCFLRTNGCSLNEEDRQRDEWLHRLLFQYMSVASDTMEQSEVEELTVDDISDVFAGDDAHLLQAHALVLARNKFRSEVDEKFFEYDLPVIDATAFPSSRSQDFRGFIPKDKFRSLLNILLASRLVTSAVFTRFKNEAGITWDLFNSALTTTMPNIFSALPRLLVPFILDKGLSHEQMKSSTRKEVTSLIREAFKQTPQVSRGGVFDLPLLVKLTTVLPLDLPVQNASVISTVTQEDFNLNPICDRIGSNGQPLVLLIKGLALDPIRADLDNIEILLGAFLPQDETQNACVFQLSPALLIFFSDSDVVLYDADDGTDKLQIQILGRDAAELTLSERIRTGRLVIPGGAGRPAATSCETQVISIDLVGFTAVKSELEMPFDESSYGTMHLIF